ncbi:MAG: hypothetical protein A2087_09595 [Spirochaetes bacterium GWD1_61_31]|nr:MAG: hypothetical protein A2Y37_07190 [Spirochaetes bacterium GWB1_60_80]OHD29255.1 MAG: hypothetical protein A2004_09095 [Spirochaetes bacterium GWC1_61_12]OHD39257.1 MAG: hypothetical protein A2087_09595 [Spirochaetes bacterium GWD1_61_31]OHD43660.1 MAG: hypothetical protein A2Y35_06385 [Spirochaetes bacterium GWE1_60_18]OHD59165.1 MAG: hypothetical protein A2Y32_14875 [Spirochaetes bacterium GWF1_60_12]
MEKAGEFHSKLLILNETERRQGYQAGSGLVASSYYEQLGLVVPAVFAACADLSQAYATGMITIDDYAGSLNQLAANWMDQSSEDGRLVNQSIEAVRLFLASDWAGAEKILANLAGYTLHDDSFQAWMYLVAQIELNESRPYQGDQIVVYDQLATAYGSMMSRYRLLPQYWYYAMRINLNDSLAIDAAERCINLAPTGPFALLAREALAELWSLPKGAAVGLLTVQEIQDLIQTALADADLEQIKSLFPLLGLADNPATLYALGALQGLADNQIVRQWIQAESAKANGRLAERLRYAGGRP